MTRALGALDWTIIVAYLGLALGAGLYVSRRAGRSLDSFFVADRGLPWWWLGTSMVATTFAADTPLVVTGLVARHGVAGNWFWWSWAISHVAMAVVFAGMWRRAGILTDAELVELRYAGKSAAILRGFKAGFFALAINGIVLGWVIRAMTKIADPFIHWEEWLGAATHARLAAAWPGWLQFGTLDDTLTVLVLFGLVTLYSTLGGIRGVILTDLVQFGIALVGSITFAWIAVAELGGLGGLLDGLARHYPDSGALLAFVPRGDAAWLPVQVFAIYLAVQWWAQYFSDGSGYLAQRLFTARSDAHAEAGGLWFVVANYALRTWPWVLIGLVSLVLFPLGAGGDGAAAVVAADREMAYPVLMAQLLPTGLLGLLVASLLAAFMSTVDTHLNWGTSYLINDVYRRFLRPAASQRELVLASRTGVVLLATLALVAAAQITSIERAWRFFVALGAGLGLPAMLRWVWWRVTAWTEIAGMVTAGIAAPLLYAMFPQVRDEYLLVIIVGLATAAALAATFLSPPVPREHLARFVARVRPPGLWAGLHGGQPRAGLRWLALGFLVGNVAVFGLTFGLGACLLGAPLRGALALVLGAAALPATLACTARARAALGAPPPLGGA